MDINSSKASEFIDAALEMEIRAHSLSDLAYYLRKKGSDNLEYNTQKYEELNERLVKHGGMSDEELGLRAELRSLELKINEIKSTFDEVRATYNKGEGNGILFLKMILCFILINTLHIWASNAIIMALEELNFYWGEVESAEGILNIIAIVLLIIVERAIYKSTMAKKERRVLKKTNESLNNKIYPIQKRVDEINDKLASPVLISKRVSEREVQSRKHRVDAAIEDYNRLSSQAADCEKKAYEIKMLIEDLHNACGLVPRKYRHLDCLIMCKHILNNGWAKDLEGAFAYYEEKNYRNEVMREGSTTELILGNLTIIVPEVKPIIRVTNENVSGVMSHYEAENNVLEARVKSDEMLREAQEICEKWNRN